MGDVNENQKSPVKKLANGHRPLHAVKSAAGRLQDQDGKYKSASSLDGTPAELKVSCVEERRRTRSAPLTVEAVSVAQGLNHLSDILTQRYTAKRPSVANRMRRHTFGSPNEIERRSFHFDYQNYEDMMLENDTIAEETHEFQRGTSV